MNIPNLNSFLKFGYFLQYKNPNYCIDLSTADKSLYAHCTEPELIEIGSKLWIQAIEKQFDINEKHVIPLSGGLDSRAILATLLQFTSAENLHTYTFGIPGTLDFDIGCEIAKKVGTKHLSFNLNNYLYTTDDLIDISKRVDFQTLLFLHPDIHALEQQFGDCNIWSGAIIDTFFGVHNHSKTADNWADAKRNSIQENLFTKSVDLSSVSDDDLFDLIDDRPEYNGGLCLEHIIDLLNRQLKYIAPHVLIKGFKYKTLFLDRQLTSLALSIDQKHITDQDLYKKIFLHSFGDLFKIRTKTSNGLPLFSGKHLQLYKKIKYRALRYINRLFPSFIDPFTNYRDFNYEIRYNNNLRTIIRENIFDLKSRNIVSWIDIDKIWHDHIDKNKNHTDALLVLASLEIHLKAGKII